MHMIYSVSKVEQINDYLFTDTYKSNIIKIDMTVMRVNDGKMSTSLVNTGDISPETA